MKILSGTLKGRTLLAPPSAPIRPTRSRVRQSLFNILDHGVHAIDWESTRLLDAFSGLGTFGFEALSRGAHHVTFLEKDGKTAEILRKNARLLGVTPRIHIRVEDACLAKPPSPQDGGYTLVFADPPYGLGLGDAFLHHLHAHIPLAPRALVILEEAAHHHIPLPPSFTQQSKRVYGKTQLLFLTLNNPG